MSHQTITEYQSWKLTDHLFENSWCEVFQTCSSKTINSSWLDMLLNYCWNVKYLVIIWQKYIYFSFPKCSTEISSIFFSLCLSTILHNLSKNRQLLEFLIHFMDLFKIFFSMWVIDFLGIFLSPCYFSIITAIKVIFAVSSSFPSCWVSIIKPAFKNAL